MELLPAHHDDFRKEEYWNSFFKKRDKKSFEWYGNFSQIYPIVQKSIQKENARILMLGCGNSSFSYDLYQKGYRNIVNIDFSDIVIEEMKLKYKQCSEMKWIKMDMTEMEELEKGSFDIVFDKGALDALMSSNTEQVIENAEKMFGQIVNVLEPASGKYILISMAEDYILECVMSYFVKKLKNNVFVKALENKQKALAPFVFTFRKRSNAGMGMVGLEKNFTTNACSVECSNWVIKQIQAVQFYAMTKDEIAKIQPGRSLKAIELLESENELPRYIVHVVDVIQGGGPNGSCAVFLIPQGREHEWMFGTEKGRMQVAQGSGFGRLIVIALGRGHVFENAQAVQNELSPKVVELLPTIGKNENVPYLTVQEGIGARKVIFHGQSKQSGSMFVEDVPDVEKNAFLRRMVFQSNTSVIQSEMKYHLQTTECAKSNATIQFDFQYLAFSYHIGMIHGISALHGSKAKKCLIVGLGGGAVAMKLYHSYPNLHITVCELDSYIAQVATDYFGFVQNERMKLFVQDGIEYIADLSALEKVEQTFDFIIIDVDAKDKSVGMSCPPKNFVSETFINQCRSILVDGGALIYNVSCRDDSLYALIKSKISKSFDQGTLIENDQDEDDVNKVLFAVRNHKMLVIDELEKHAALVAHQDNFVLADLMHTMSIV